MDNKFDLTGKVAVIAGASTAIGANAAMAYAKAGANVALLADDMGKLESVMAEIVNMGHRAICVECDVTNEASVKKAVKTILDTFGQIDILLNNSGIALRDGLEEMTDAEWNKSFGAILKGVYLVSKNVIPHMKKRGYGKIINISSANSRIWKNGRWERSPREIVTSLTRELADLYAQYGITVNTVGPEKIIGCSKEKDSTGCSGNKDDFGGTVLYLSSDEASVVRGQFVNVGFIEAIA